MEDHDPAKATQEQSQAARLLFEVEELLRVAPTTLAFAFDSGSDENLAWLGRTAAAINRWDTGPISRARANAALMQVPSKQHDSCQKAIGTLKMLLQQAQSDLRMELGRGSVVVEAGRVFEYFDELRKVIETARTDVLFVDPYLDADFVSQYLQYVAEGVSIRLLSSPKKRATLLPAVKLFAQQSGRSVSVRVSDGLHDRYLFIDRAACYLSGASFKDGAKNATTVLAPITDAFQVMRDTYEQQWDRGAQA